MNTTTPFETGNPFLSNSEQGILEIFKPENLDQILAFRRALYDRSEEAHYQRTPVTYTPPEVEFLALFECFFKHKKEMVIDHHNRDVLALLSHYFAGSEGFYPIADKLKIKNPNLTKGLLVAGGIGTGKTFLMRLFSHNPRQGFTVINSKEIATAYEERGPEAIKKFYGCPAAYMSRDCFYQPIVGLCIDDAGAEDVACHMGNRRVVIADITETRYAHGRCGELLHLTTNLTAQQLADFYGARVASRLRETMNVIELLGPDRRR